MPYLITQSYFPPNKSDEVSKKYIELMEKYPPDESLGKQLVQSAVSSNRDGIIGMSITEVKQEKMFDASNRAAKMMVEFRTIEGFNYKIRFWQTVEEALEAIGMG